MKTQTENSGRKQAGRFQKGVSGNPRGKPTGARHRITVLAETLMAGDAEAVVRAVVAAAKGGDMTAARLILDRISPPRRGCPVSFKLPTIETAADISKVLTVVLASVACGDLTPDEATAISGVVEVKRKAIETEELGARLTALEQAAEDRSQK